MGTTTIKKRGVWSMTQDLRYQEGTYTTSRSSYTIRGVSETIKREPFTGRTFPETLKWAAAAFIAKG